MLSELESSELTDSVDLTSLSSFSQLSFGLLEVFLVLLRLFDMVSQQMPITCFGAKVLALSDHFPFEPHIKGCQ